MSEKKKAVEKALIDGATRGHSGEQLYEFVRRECPDAKSKKIVAAAFHALSDPELRDRNILDVIYALALQRRLADDESEPAEGDSKRAALPLRTQSKKRSKD